jgi:hypothetical protein
MIAALRALRDDIEEGRETVVTTRFDAAIAGRKNWVNERMLANWVELQKEPADYPSVSDRLFGGLIGRRTKKK